MIFRSFESLGINWKLVREELRKQNKTMIQLLNPEETKIEQ